LLTGQPPLQGRSAQEILVQVIRGEVPRPRQLNPAIPKALEAVCRKAMALEPEDRYATALDLAADVDRWLADEPVAACREPWREKLWRWLRRYRTVVTAAVVLLLTAVVALTVGLVLVHQEKAQEELARQQAEAARQEAEAARALAERNEQSAAVQR